MSMLLFNATFKFTTINGIIVTYFIKTYSDAGEGNLS